MLYPESTPPPQLSVHAAERHAQLTAVAQLRRERKLQRQQLRQGQRKAGPKPATAAS